MKNFGSVSARAAGVAGALVLLAASPRAASAQAVGGYLGTNGRPGTSAPNQPQQTIRSGAVILRPGGAPGVSPGYNPPRFIPPGFTQPGFDRRGFNAPVYNNPQGYNNAPAYGNAPVYGSGMRYNNAPGYDNAPGFRREWSSGPVVTVPDAAQGGLGGSDRRPSFGGSSGSGGVSDLPGYPFGARRGDINSGGFRPVRPVGPVYGASRSGRSGGTDLRITGPLGAQRVPPAVYQNNYIYNNYNVNRSTTIVNAPPLLGGYYYGNYCDASVSALTYPSVYSVYAGFPPYIFNSTPNVIIVGQPMYQPYVTAYLPFDMPSYPVTYNENNYYVASESRAREIEGGGAPARAALKNAYPADSYQAAFADIARAWTDGDIAPLRKHVRDTDTRISVFLSAKYSYSIASGDFVQITRDALDRLHTVSFDLTRLRKSKTGDVTAYGAHVYRTGDGQGSADGSGATVPFDQNGPDAGGTDGETTSPYDRSGDPAVGVEKTVYVSYTLRHRDGQWYIIGVDSSDHNLVPTP